MKQDEYLLIGEERKSRRVIKKFLAQDEEGAKKISKLKYNHVINPELYQRID